MPAATTRADLLAVTEKEFTKLTKLLADLGEEAALCEYEDSTTIKDVIGHRAHWSDLFLGWYAQGQETGQADIPAKGYKWSQIKEYNDQLREQQRGLGWDEVREMLAASHARLIDFIENQTDSTLYAAPMTGGNGKWTTGRFAEAAGASAYRSAAKFVRAALRAQKAGK
ncbi:MAG: hypothetical protein CSA68_09010 [Rhodobacterales bacterium]|nr:MAG: hypothetical protein CSA68_09010 [Rhodobacterales bacterium]